MKTILVCIITFLFFISCSPESDFETAMPPSNYEQKTERLKSPANPSNPYDFKGEKLYESLQLYHQERQSPRSVSDVKGQMRFITESLGRKSTASGRLILFTDEIVESIMEDPDNSMILIVQNSILQVYAKNHLISFLQDLIIKRQDEFSLTYDYIVDYETAVLNDTVFSSEEVETILTVASISRYSLYSAEERKDRDWETNVGGKPIMTLFKTNEVPIILIIALLQKMI